MLRRLTLILLLLASLSPRLPVTAQGGETNTPGSTTIHVVQRDETLFGIAMQYGTTVEAIAEANGITDPRYITVGQRLLIPNPQMNVPGAVVRYVIQPGDSLRTLTRTFNTTLDSLVAANHLTNPAQLYVGQEITISQGAADASLPGSGILYIVQPGENLYRIALRYHVSVTDILKANHRTWPTSLFAQERLWIPVAENTAIPKDLPTPITALEISPIPAVQGETVQLHIATNAPATITGTFMTYTLHMVTPDANQHYALIGVHAFTAAGVYPMTLTVADSSGLQSTLTLRIKVIDGGYGAEAIALTNGQENLLNPTLTEPEWERVATIMSGFSSQRYFNGLMGLPSTGAITSEFGTRRDYNNGALDTFHSGTDFGGAPGSPIFAPAAGIVVLAENLPVRGNATIIDHGWGVYTGYWHQTEINVAVGDVVQPGQVIGTIGSTGRVTGPHLHWEMWVGGVQVDPMQWVRQNFP